MSYTASFVGGPLDGQSQQVASVAPGRVVHADDPQHRAVAWTGKPLPRRPYAVDREHHARTRAETARAAREAAGQTTIEGT